MRIAISGTHASGKSTLIAAFCARHPEYAFEPEPYEVMSEVYGEVFAEKPTIEDFEKQLEYQLEVLGSYSHDDNVIFERCPADFLAYMMAIAGSRSHLEPWITAARPALARLELIVFVPLEEGGAIEVHESEDLVLREEVDDLLREILFGEELDLFTASSPTLIEARGRIDERVAAIDHVLARGIGVSRPSGPG